MILCIMILNKLVMVMMVSGLIVLTPKSSQVDCQLVIMILIGFCDDNGGVRTHHRSPYVQSGGLPTVDLECVGAAYRVIRSSK